jgi:soluble lytic murein transglycosylase-like protein
MLLVAVIPGYMVSLSGSADETPPVECAPVNLPARLQSMRAMGIDCHIKDVATRYGVAEDLIAAIIEVESSFDPRAVSRRGARGLMQLMPATAALLGVGDPFDPRENIEAGVRHLRALMDQFDNDLPLVLAAYNAGAQAVVQYRGIPPYPQTRQYVSRILRQLNREGTKTIRSEPGSRFRAGHSVPTRAL